MVKKENGENQRELDERIRKETNAMRDALASAVTNWASLENMMASLMGWFFHNPVLGMALYYTPTSTEARISLLNTCFHNFCEFNKDTQEIWKFWKDLEIKINRSKSTRNKIVHGNISVCEDFNKHKHVRLDSALNDFSPRVNGLSKYKQFLGKRDKPYQKPGMSVSDVHNSAGKFLELAVICNRFSFVFITYRNNATGLQSWQEVLRELSSHHLHPPR